MKTITRVMPLVLLFTGACKDVEEHDHHDHDHEVITTVELIFSASDGSGDLVYVWADPEDDGDPVIDDIVLSSATADYQLSVHFWNELEDPAEEITGEIGDEAEEHQVFFTGTGVEGPATGTNPDAVMTHAYADTDGEGLPVGLLNDVTTLQVGTGQLEVTLRHLPFENDEPVKAEGMAEDVASGGFGAIGGDNDIQVTFNIEVE